MSSKQLLRALLALAVLLVLWGAFTVVRWASRERVETLALPALTAVDVDSVVMTWPGDTLRLVRSQGALWRVNRNLASAAAVREFFEALADSAARSELVARSAASHERMGVDSVGGRRVRFIGGGKVLADLVFGTSGRRWGTAYVRRTGEEAVYLLSGQLPGLVERGVDGWRERRIAALVPDSIAEVEIARGRRSFTLRRAPAGWTFADGRAADSGAVAQLLEEFREITAAGFPTAAQQDSVALAPPDRRLSVRGVTGQALLSLLFDSTAYAYWVRHDSGGPVYRVDGWRADRLTPADTALREPGR